MYFSKLQVKEKNLFYIITKTGESGNDISHIFLFWRVLFEKWYLWVTFGIMKVPSF